MKAIKDPAPIPIDQTQEVTVELHWDAGAVCDLDLLCFVYTRGGVLVDVVDGVNRASVMPGILHTGDSQKSSESISLMLGECGQATHLCFGVCAQSPAVSLFDSCRIVSINVCMGGALLVGNIECPSYPLRMPLSFAACFLSRDAASDGWTLHHSQQLACAHRGFTKLLPICRKLMQLPDATDDMSQIVAVDKAEHLLLDQNVQTLHYQVRWASSGHCSLSAFCLGAAGDTLGVVSQSRNADPYNRLNKATEGIDSPQALRKTASLLVNIGSLDASIADVVVALECSSHKLKKIAVTLKRDGELIAVLKPKYKPCLVLNKLVRLGKRFQMVSIMEEPQNDLADAVMLFRGKPKKRTITIKALRGITGSCRIRARSKHLPYLEIETPNKKKLTSEGAMHHFDFPFTVSSFFGRKVTLTFDVLVGHKVKLSCETECIIDKKQPDQDVWIGPDSSLRVLIS